MKRRNELRRRAEIVDVATQPRDRRVGLEQRVRGERPERDDDLRADGVDLAREKRLARRDLFRRRIAIARRPALDDVRDVDVARAQADRLDDLRQQLPARPTNGSPWTSSSAPGASPTNISCGVRDCPRRTQPAGGPSGAACSACSRRCGREARAGRRPRRGRRRPAESVDGASRAEESAAMGGPGMPRPSGSSPRRAIPRRHPRADRTARSIARARRGRARRPRRRAPRTAKVGRQISSAGHCVATARVGDARQPLDADRAPPPRRRLSTSAAAPRRPSAETSVTRLVSTSKPASGARDVVGDDQIDLLRAACARAAATGSPVSAAKPTSTGRVPSPRSRPRSARMSAVRSSVQRQRRRPSRSCRRRRRSAGV